MNASKGKSKQQTKKRIADTPYGALVLRCFKKAQQTAARENARYGLPLIVEKKRSPRRLLAK